MATNPNPKQAALEAKATAFNVPDGAQSTITLSEGAQTLARIESQLSQVYSLLNNVKADVNVLKRQTGPRR